MRRYFFNLQECGKTTADSEGQMLPDLEAARLCAVEAARAIMCAEVTEGRLCLSCNIEVMDEEGRMVIDLPFREALVVTGI